ncbi:MAG: helicase-related protein [Deltaproteobacteria bacterium]|nr:helicase-related protein [Deltaproteobacteria bacterium]
MLRKFRDGALDILLGTQMVAKGHDFPRVTLVGVILADTTLTIPDFRSAERTFQLITQVLGRAGRDERPGRAIVQTFNPNHYAIKCATRHDFEGFFAAEKERRSVHGYPPFSRMALFRTTGRSVDDAYGAARRVREALERSAKQLKIKAEFVGPARAPIGRIKTRYRYQLLAKAPTAGNLVRLAEAALAGVGKLPGTAELRIDIDPQSMM